MDYIIRNIKSGILEKNIFGNMKTYGGVRRTWRCRKKQPYSLRGKRRREKN